MELCLGELGIVLGDVGCGFVGGGCVGLGVVGSVAECVWSWVGARVFCFRDRRVGSFVCLF